MLYYTLLLARNFWQLRLSISAGARGSSDVVLTRPQKLQQSRADEDAMFRSPLESGRVCIKEELLQNGPKKWCTAFDRELQKFDTETGGC
jgi:hypothetical protein